MEKEKFKFKDIFSMLKESGQGWMANDPFGKSASVAYYAIFSLPALLIIIVTVAGAVYGEEAIQGHISEQISELIDPESAEAVETIISESKTENNSIWSSIIGVAILLFGATGLFIQLQKTLNNIWDVEANPSSGIKKLLTDRATSLGIILVIGFLLLISLVLTSVLSLLSDWIVQHLPEFFLYGAFVLSFVLSLAVITLLFAAIYKVLPDVKIGWKTVWVGSILTAVLFEIGKFAIGLYLGKADPGSAFGAAGSVILILIWVSYSCMIIFFGAEFTQVYARRYGHDIKPSDHARYTAEYRIAHKLVNDVDQASKEIKEKRKEGS